MNPCLHQHRCEWRSAKSVVHGLQRAAVIFCVHGMQQLRGKVASEDLRFEKQPAFFFSFFFTKDKSKKVTNTCQPIYKGCSTQGISCSFNGIWLHSQLGQGLGWWCVFAGQQTFGFCLREHLKQRGFQDLACSVHTLFFLCSALYHFMFASCMNSCGGGKGSGRPRHFPGKWGPICYADTDKTG